MQAVILGLLMPIIPLLIQRCYQKEQKYTVAKLLERYAVYTLLTTLFTTAVMAVLCDDNTSFMEKMDKSPVFVMKYIAIAALAVAVISFAEWCHTTRKLALQVEWDKYKNCFLMKVFRKFLCPGGLFLLALLVCGMNLVLIFDNVVWGDEAYAANLIRHDVDSIFQVLTLEENHPPLYYLWLKLFAESFGYSAPVYHFASYVPFVIGIILAVTLLRKHFGSLPAAFFVIISGLSAPCLEYNMEIRMYALAFLGMAGAFYCAYRIFDGSRGAAWIGMVFWSLVAAYSHYYALVAAGILMFVTFVGAFLKFRGKIWIKGLLSLLVFVAAYMPWLSQLFRATKSVSGNWWMTEIDTVGQCLTMIFCGQSMAKIILLLAAGLFLLLLLAESAIFSMKRGEEKTVIRITTPSAAGWSPHTWTVAAGLLTILGTLVFAYGISVLMTPLLTGRYLYPLCAITAIILVTETGRLFTLLEDWQRKLHQRWFLCAGKIMIFLILAVLLVKGIGNYKAYKAVAEAESAGTKETLYLIGEPTEETEMVNNGIMHIGWTVLDYYYPDTRIRNGSYDVAESNDFWYFTPDFLENDNITELQAQGYSIAGYGEHQISKYHFVLYHIFREKTPKQDAAKVP